MSLCPTGAAGRSANAPGTPLGVRGHRSLQRSAGQAEEGLALAAEEGKRFGGAQRRQWQQH